MSCAFGFPQNRFIPKTREGHSPPPLKNNWKGRVPVFWPTKRCPSLALAPAVGFWTSADPPDARLRPVFPHLRRGAMSLDHLQDFVHGAPQHRLALGSFRRLLPAKIRCSRALNALSGDQGSMHVRICVYTCTYESVSKLLVWGVFVPMLGRPVSISKFFSSFEVSFCWTSR